MIPSDRKLFNPLFIFGEVRVIFPSTGLLFKSVKAIASSIDEQVYFYIYIIAQVVLDKDCEVA